MTRVCEERLRNVSDRWDRVSTTLITLRRPARGELAYALVLDYSPAVQQTYLSGGTCIHDGTCPLALADTDAHSLFLF